MPKLSKEEIEKIKDKNKTKTKKLDSGKHIKKQL
jgi:hypothetical protein